MYNLQKLGLMQTSKGSITFPNQITIEIGFGPKSAFGAASEHGRLFIGGRQNEILFDANSGRTLFCASPPLEPLHVDLTIDGDVFELRGNVLRYRADCTREDELDGALQALHFVLTPLLSLAYYDPPFIEYAKVWIGAVEFRVQHADALREFTATNWDTLCNDAKIAFQRVLLCCRTENRRLCRAVHYFHIACRLRVSGRSDWEFTAEAILNLAKVLDVLFAAGETRRDAIRQELSALGYSSEEIEREFMTILFLRNMFDVGHPKAAIPPQDELQILYHFLEQVFHRFRELLNRVISRVEAGAYVLRPHDESMSKEDGKAWDRIIDNVKQHARPRQPNQAPAGPNDAQG